MHNIIPIITNTSSPSHHPTISTPVARHQSQHTTNIITHHHHHTTFSPLLLRPTRRSSYSSNGSSSSSNSGSNVGRRSCASSAAGSSSNCGSRGISVSSSSGGRRKRTASYTELTEAEVNRVDEGGGAPLSKRSLLSYFGFNKQAPPEAGEEGPEDRRGRKGSDTASLPSTNSSTDDCPTLTDFSTDSEGDSSSGSELGVDEESGKELASQGEGTHQADVPHRVGMTTFSFPFCTYNLNGLSIGASRSRFIKANLLKLSKNYHIILLQETHLGRKQDYSELDKLLPGWKILYENDSTKHAGVATCLSPGIQERYVVSKVEGIAPELLQEAFRGRVLSINLSAKDDQAGLASANFTNLYLPSGSKDKAKSLLLNAIREGVPVMDFNAVAGNFNFVLCDEDHSPSRKWKKVNYYDTSEELRTAWDDFANKLKLTEVPQNQHTHYQLVMDSLEASTTAKLDRIYTSHSQADYTLFEACGHLAEVPFSIFCKFSADQVGHLSPSGRAASDHAPVGVFYAPKENTNRRDRRIPVWVVDHPGFERHFNDRWSPAAPHLGVEQGLERLKDHMYQAAGAVLKELKGKARAVVGAHGQLATAIALLRIITLVPFSHVAMTKKIGLYPHLKPLVNPIGEEGRGSRPSAEGLKAFINSIIVQATADREQDFAEFMSSKTFPLGNNHQAIVSNPTGPRAKGLAEKLKVWFPSSRRKIRFLKEKHRSGAGFTEPTNNPDEMASIAKNFWQKIWAKAPKKGRPRLQTYLGEARKIDHAHIPDIPDLDSIADIIIGTNNSCAGPDGIPFKAYRVLAEACAPVIAKMLTFFSNGGLPSSEYNKGLLFLLPKADTMLAADTRPISVTNCDNRILAKVLVAAITPALSDPNSGIHQAQKGGISGRQGLDHVRELSEKFYSAAEGERDPYYLMFMDTKKAFDSIHHSFIFAVLAHFGLPWWVRFVVKALLHDVSVSPNFGGTSSVWIKIKRGVKQGCPLSPWIFAMCMDVLIRRLAAKPSVDVFAFVDDVALGSDDFKNFRASMKAIDVFSKASGLGINHRKTKGVCSSEEAWPGDGAYHRWAKSRDCPWRGQFEIAIEYVYLGFLTGKWATTAKIFRAAFLKFRNKLTAYKPAIKLLTPSKRFDVYNIFISPLLSYLAPLYCQPAEGKFSHSSTNLLIRKALVPFGGNGYSYHALIAPADGVGFGNPIRDPWALTVAAVVAQADLVPFRGVTSAKIQDRIKVSMRVSKQREHMTIEFINWDLFSRSIRGAPHPTFDPDAYPLKDMAKRRKAIYNTCVKGQLKKANFNGILAGRLKARGLPCDGGSVLKLHRQFRTLSKRLSNATRYHQMAMIHNAVATRHRCKRFANLHAEDYRCAACGASDDSLRHTLGNTCISSMARTAFGSCIGYELSAAALGAKDDWHTSNLFFREGGNCAQSTTATVIFNHSVWLAQVKHFRTKKELPAPDTAVRTIVDIALGTWARARMSKWAIPRTPSGKELTNLGGNKFGSSSTRTKEQKLAAKAEAIRLIRSLPPSTAICFTDGSAIPNPGPCGTGVLVYLPEHRYLLNFPNPPSLALSQVGPPLNRQDHPPDTRRKAAGPLAAYAGLIVEGEGSNNIAELWGPPMAIQLLEWHERQTGKQHMGPIAIFIDSQLTIDICRYKSRPKSNILLCHASRRVVGERKLRNALYMYWLAGHADIEPNDKVDVIAKRGAVQAANGVGLKVDVCRATSNFLPPDQPPYLFDGLPP
jgi:ribonuclease HI